jgi:hypothetical protein
VHTFVYFNPPRSFSSRVAGFAVCVVALSLAACGSEPSQQSLGPPKVATTFSLGAGPMPDVASDPTTHKA